MGSLGWEQCRSNVGPLMERDPDDGPRLLETFSCWSFELQRSVRATYDYLLEEVLIEDDCQRCQRQFWRQMRFAFLWCPTCRKLVSKEEPEAEADPKWQRTRRWSWACRACNTQNWPSRIKCRTCKTPKLLEPAWLSKQREDLRQKECARIAPLTIASAAPSNFDAEASLAPPIWQKQAEWLSQNPYADNTMQSPFVQEMILQIILAKWRKAAERPRPGQCALQLRSECLEMD